MFFKKKPNPTPKKILKLKVQVNVAELSSWIKSGEDNLTPISQSEWSSYKPDFNYEIRVIPINDSVDLYFHKTANEYTHSINACIDMEDKIPSIEDCRNELFGLPEIEIEIWNGQLGVNFDRRLLLMAPLHEAIHLMNNDKTSTGEFRSKERIIKVPVAYESLEQDAKVTRHIEVHEIMDDKGVIYSTNMACLVLETPYHTLFS